MSTSQSTDLPVRFVKELLWAAEHKDNEYNLSGKDARKLLEALEIPWIPEVEKHTNKADALRAFKAAVRAKYGTKSVDFREYLETDEEKGLEYDCLVVSVDNRWPAEPLELMMKGSGLSRFFEEWGSGWGAKGCVETTYISRKPRKCRS